MSLFETILPQKAPLKLPPMGMNLQKVHNYKMLLKEDTKKKNGA